jgi:hypothetical protein
MAKPKLPDELRKDKILQVRFLQSEIPYLLQQAKNRNCRTLSQYIRLLISEDIKNSTYGIPRIQRR